MRALTALVCLIGSQLYSQDAWRDPSPHRVQFVEVERDVKLEVLDWGGSGRALVFLTGLGNTAHVFDDFAQKLVPEYHVYGITRRGFGASSVPATGYDAVRLGNDVLAVLDSLKISKPVLVGHSVGGSELSSVASRQPDRVSGLVYLDAGYGYAFSEAPLRRERPPSDGKQAERAGNRSLPPGPTESDLASFSALLDYRRRTTGVTPPEAEYRQHYTFRPGSGLVPHVSPVDTGAAIRAGTQQWTGIPVPALAIFALPKRASEWSKENRPEYVTRTAAQDERQASAFEKGVPSARVVRIANADHYVFLSNEADVLREMRAFLSGLR